MLREPVYFRKMELRQVQSPPAGAAGFGPPHFKHQDH